MGRERRFSCASGPLLFLVNFCFFSFFGVQPLKAGEVLDVRVGVHPDRTRFVLEVTTPPQYEIFTLPDPFRLVIDLPDLAWSKARQKGVKVAGLVRSLRFGKFKPGISRIVLDLNQAARVVTAFVMPPGAEHRSRLVVDLEPISRAAYVGGNLKSQRFRSAEPLPPAITLREEAVLKGAVFPKRRPYSALELRAQRQQAARKLIVIDAGHGGIDPGAIGVAGTKEKDLTLGYAFALKEKFLETGRYRVVMTRTGDQSMALRERVLKAQSVNADLFISLHANTHKDNRIAGVSIYTLSERGSDREAEALAAKENKADTIIGVDLSEQSEVVSRILIDLAQRETNNQGKLFAEILVDELKREARLLKRPHRSAGFAVLKSPVIPSVLVELGYLTNRKEERLLNSKRHREELLDAIRRGVDKYFGHG